MQRHLADSQKFDTSVYAEAPPTVAWNQLVDVVKKMAKVVVADFEQRMVETNWTYEKATIEPGLSRQRRVRQRVHMNGMFAREYATPVEAIAEVRTRETCAEPSEWTTDLAQPDATLANAAQAAVKKQPTIPLDQVAFPGTPESLLPIASDIMLKRWGFAPSPNGISFPLRSAYREDSYDEAKGLRVTVRSMLSLTPRVLGDSVQFTPDARLEWRGDVGDDGSRWFREPGDPVAADFLARLAERVHPRVVLANEVNPEHIKKGLAWAPSLDSPPAKLVGPYKLTVKFASAPQFKPNGEVWDAGVAVLQTLIEWVPAGFKVAQAISGDPSAAVALAKQFVTNKKEGFDNKVAEYISGAVGDIFGQFSAPDLAISLNLPGTDDYVLNGPQDSNVATWIDPIDVTLNGAGFVEWKLIDRDVGDFDPVAYGAMSIERLANACDVVCDSVAGAVVCMQLDRVKQ